MASQPSVNAIQIDANGRAGMGVQGPDGELHTVLGDNLGNLAISGGVVAGAADSGSPLKIGGLASDPGNPPTPVGSGQRVNAFFDLEGRLVTYSGSPLDPSNDQVSVGADSQVPGCDTFFKSDLAATAVNVKSSEGRLYGIQFSNNSNGVAFIQLFDLPAASVTLGTTPPKKAIGCKTVDFVNVTFNPPIAFQTAITIAAATTSTGSSAPNAGVTVNLDIK